MIKVLKVKENKVFKQPKRWSTAINCVKMASLQPTVMLLN